ncbi:hypothetical protein LC607_06945 [Nostoc sp. CHAB 5824]|nr:hypothetical protein [Nostoc sp. CHAB 5824]
MNKIQNLQAPAPVVLFEELSDGEAYLIGAGNVNTCGRQPSGPQPTGGRGCGPTFWGVKIIL